MDKMILNFKVTYGNTPTLFPEKIWAGLIELEEYKKYPLLYREYGTIDVSRYPLDMDVIKAQQPKIHTIRKGERWKAGDKIHPYIWARTKKMQLIAPPMTCVSVQGIEIRNSLREGTIQVRIDGKRFFEVETNGERDNPRWVQLSQNDGLTPIGFRNWFSGEGEPFWFTGQIIHWTDFKY